MPTAYVITCAPKDRKPFRIECPDTMTRADVRKIALDLIGIYTPERVAVSAVVLTNIDDDLFGAF